MHALIQQLVAQKPVITDGAWGTELQRQGLDPGESPDHWNLKHPECVEAVARAYVEAGSRIILTNTFQANRIVLQRHGLAGRMEEINRAGVEISRRAAEGRAYVFASLGPSGKLLVSGEVSDPELQEVFAEQAKALARAKPDALVIETMSDVEEAKLAVSSCRQTGLPVVACMAFDSGKTKDRTMMGTTPEEAATALAAAGADVIGANCGQGPEHYLSLAKRLTNATDRPLWIKPNAGSPELAGDGTVYPTTPSRFAEAAPGIIRAGVTFLGGCCGTGPEFVRALCGILARYSDSSCA
jgi:5-methyltetrahydrofolate--homocysteine methyltransferase